MDNYDHQQHCADRLVAIHRDTRIASPELHSWLVNSFVAWMTPAGHPHSSPVITAALTQASTKTFRGEPTLRNWELGQLIRGDAPRYEPPPCSTQCGHRFRQGQRTGQLCGKHSASYHTITDPATGEQTRLPRCTNHRLPPPPPVPDASPTPPPNVGGLLPVYWPQILWGDLYKQRPGWTEPDQGICADDWPTHVTVAQVDDLLAGAERWLA